MDADRAVRAALEAGARGFILKSDAARDLVAAVEALQSGNTFFTARVADMVLSGYLGSANTGKRAGESLPALTFREREVIQLVAEGHSTKEVAALLDFSSKTAETHRSNIMRKLNLQSVSDLVLWAIRNGIIHVANSPVDSNAQAAGQVAA
jgi:DNA-binding NarL/FixJ family response regulator